MSYTSADQAVQDLILREKLREKYAGKSLLEYYKNDPPHMTSIVLRNIMDSSQRLTRYDLRKKQ